MLENRVRERSGGRRFQALYRDLEGAERSAGHYDTWDQANEVSKLKAAWIRGISGGLDPELKATILVQDFMPEFRRHHIVSNKSMGNYVSVLRNHVLPRCGKDRLADVDMGTMRRIVTAMREAGRSPQLIKRARDVFSAYLGTAVELGYCDANPVKGLRVPRKPQRAPIPVMTPEQFEALRKEMPTPGAHALVGLIGGSGMRFGEATALLVRDIDFTNGRVDIHKGVSEPGREFCSEGTRFKVEPYTKDGFKRVIFIQPALARVIKKYADKSGLKGGDLLFPHQLVVPMDGQSTVSKHRQELTRERLDEIEAQMGRYTDPKTGRTYRHGTLTAYTKKCRCEWCRQAGTEYYNERKRQQRLIALGLPATTPKQRTHHVGRDSEHLGRKEWSRIFYPACDRTGITAAAQLAGLERGPTPYQLRHTHASWLLFEGEKPEVIMTRLGHKDLNVTSLYVQMLFTGESTVAHLDNIISWDDEDEDD